MTTHNRFYQICCHNWVVTLFLLAVFWVTNGYTLGWDDQHLEIPLLKSLIDPQLYVGDYYVESLKKNFTSYLYPILARLITIDQIPVTYCVLFWLSRYFLFYWMYRFWKEVSGQRGTAILCVLMIMLATRVDDFLYRTFSHQEFALAIIMAGIFFIYRERFWLAAILLGVAANIHALYSLFPMTYLSAFLLFHYRRYGWRSLIGAIVLFVLSAMPLCLWVGRDLLSAQTVSGSPSLSEWIPLYKLACPQNFLFHEYELPRLLSDLSLFITATQTYVFLLALGFLNWGCNARFQEDKKTQIAILTGWIMLGVSFVFSYIFPSRFVLDLNLIRNTQFMLFFLAGYTVILFCELTKTNRWWAGLALAASLPFMRMGHASAALTAGFFWLGLTLTAWYAKPSSIKKGVIIFLTLVGMSGCLAGILNQITGQRFSSSLVVGAQVIGAILLFVYLCHWIPGLARLRPILRVLFLTVPFVVFTINYGSYHYRRLHIEQHSAGFWQLQRNWIDMQQYVKAHTPKESLLLVPHDMEMGGFRIFSERSVVVCYRDCGIIGFDYQAAREWQMRLKEIEPFKVMVDRPIAPAILKALFQYKVNYIVFMGYMDPGANSFLTHEYSNETFALYRVNLP
jgi:hypothetical protein